jgi:hypothetical protein
LPSQLVLIKDTKVWINGARPANTCIPPTVPGNVAEQSCGISNPKNTFSGIKINKILLKLFFYLKNKSEREFDKVTVGNSKFVKRDI